MALAFLLVYFIAYTAVKFPLYRWWCSRGLKNFAPANAIKASANQLATLRLVVGFAVGYVWYGYLGRLVIAQHGWNKWGTDWPKFFAGMLVVRWVLWSALDTYIRWPDGGISILGAGTKGFRWRVTGVVGSYCGDAVLLTTYALFMIFFIGH